MAHEVVWHPAALEDVEAIAAFIARDSHGYAASVVDAILLTTRQLSLFPEIGRVVPEWNDDAVREIFVHHYRLIYAVRAADIMILAVFHGARLLHWEIRDRRE